MTQTSVVLPELFKGIALFTPGGDLIYCRDSTKQVYWHSQLCLVLPELLQFPEPPHFLVPGYTATVDRWFCSTSQTVKTVAEAYPAVQRYKSLLNVLFETKGLVWNAANWQEVSCNPIILDTYRAQSPQLWENHDLIVRVDDHFGKKAGNAPLYIPPYGEEVASETNQGYILRLFVTGNSTSTKHTLKTIHHLLEKGLQHPYTLKVIDISKHPEQAETHQVSATPTLVRVWPKPVRRVVGELEDLSRVLQIITNT